MTADAVARLESEQGMPYHQAWEFMREEWAFLPEEESDEATESVLLDSSRPQGSAYQGREAGDQIMAERGR